MFFVKKFIDYLERKERILSEEKKLKIADFKRKRLLEADRLIESENPEKDPDPFFCRINFQLMTDPVITIYGFVYERKAIELSLNSKEEDPSNRQILTAKDCFPFPELKSKIEAFSDKQRKYQAQKDALREAALALNNQELTGEVPTLFQCPITGELIKKVVITSSGKLYDKDNLEAYLNTHNHLDEKGKPLHSKDYSQWPQLQYLINLFTYRFNKYLKEHGSPSYPSTLACL